MHVKVRYKEGKGLGAKTSPLALLFFKNGSKWTCIKLLLPRYDSLKDIFPMPLKKNQHNPYDESTHSMLPSKTTVFLPFPSHHPITYNSPHADTFLYFRKACADVFPITCLSRPKLRQV